ncbi:MAG: transglutaminase domain-containing protein [Halobacteriaceae archaeon]
MRDARWSGAADPADDGEGEVYERQFTWRHGGERLDWSVDVPERLLEYCRERTRTTAYASYAVDPFNEPVVESVAEYLEEFARSRGRDDREAVATVARFVQSIPYERDVVTTGRPEYPQFPVETLYYQQGDCEDLSILAAAVLRERGFDVAVVVLPDRRHMCLGVAVPWDLDGGYVTHEGTDYYLLETTDTGWRLGQVPPEYGDAAATVHPVNDAPLLLHRWEATPNGRDGVDIEGHVANFGTGEATDVTVAAVFERRGGTYGRLRTVTRDLAIPPGKSRSFDGTLDPPRRGADVRTRVQVRVGGRLHDETESDWDRPA